MKDPEENPRERRNLDLPIKLALRHHSWPLDFVSMFFFPRQQPSCQEVASSSLRFTQLESDLLLSYMAIQQRSHRFQQSIRHMGADVFDHPLFPILDERD